MESLEQDVESVERPEPGQVVGGYRLERPLGHGGMADVWLGTGANGAVAAIKLMRSSGEHMRKLFEREQRAVLSLQHPHLVPVFDVGDDYIATAYIDGADLLHRMRSPISVAEAIDITCAVASALSCAHEQGVVHCDVKPANILLDHKGSPFLADFGIARFVDEQESEKAKRVLGTPTYMAPEQRRGTLSPQTDQFALAKTLLAMLGGSTRIAPGLAVLSLGDQAGLERVLLRALADDADERYPDVASFAAALRALEVGDAEARTRLAPTLRDSAPFGWLQGHHKKSLFGEHIVRLEYRLSNLVKAGLVGRSAAEGFLAETGCEDFAWSLYARDERLGPIDAPDALARAKQSVVLLHGLFTNRELWQELAVGIARDNGLAVALAPDLPGFGDSKYGKASLPEGALAPAGLVRAMNAWLRLIGIEDTPSVIVGHSYSAAALLCARESELGEGVHRICLTPALFFYSWRLRLQARVNAVMARVLFRLPRKLRWLIARTLFRRDKSLAKTSMSVRDDMARSAMKLGAIRFFSVFWKLAGAAPAPAEELAKAVVVTTPDDPLVSAEQAEATITAAGLPPSQWYRLVYGGHFPQLLDDEHPEWGARNVYELVSLVDGVLEMADATARELASQSRSTSRERSDAKETNDNKTATMTVELK